MWIEFRLPDAELFDVASRAFARDTSKLAHRAGVRWLLVDLPNRLDDFARGLAVLVHLDRIILRRAHRAGVLVPTLYASGVRYQREPFGREWWQTIRDNLHELEGDCEDLATHRAAELNESGEDPHARAIAVPTGPRVFHAIVQRGGGALEDPSALLGMRPLSPRQRERAGRASLTVR